MALTGGPSLPAGEVNWPYSYDLTQLLSVTGDNSTTQRLAPVTVSGLTSGVASLTAGSYHTCAVTTSGGATCWGFNGNGQLGDNSTTQRLTPVGVSP